MASRWIRRLAVAAGALVWGALGAVGGAAGSAQAAPALWRVSDADSQIYLFGTLHALSTSSGWRTPLYDRAFAAARTVWFEADMQSGDPDTVRLLIQRYGSDPDVPLSHKLPPADAATLARQTDLARIQHLRPWAAALMLSARPTFGRPATVEQGADLVLTRAARDAGKEVRAFETLEDQARMYAGLPQPSEVRYLSSVLHERAKGPALRLPFKPAAFEAAWRAGRLTSADATELKGANPGLYDALLRRRTAAWADRIAGEMDAEPGVEMVNVGALHLLGPDGLPALLAARGYRVERVQ